MAFRLDCIKGRNEWSGQNKKNKSITSSPFVFVTALNTIGNHVSAVNCAQKDHPLPEYIIRHHFHSFHTACTDDL
jgi:hypothetical protein